LLVGPTNPEFVHALKAATGAKITFLKRTDSGDLDWPTDRVIELVNQSENRDLLILLESTGVKVVPVAS
jgi:hypothetical protein